MIKDEMYCIPSFDSESLPLVKRVVVCLDRRWGVGGPPQVQVIGVSGVTWVDKETTK